MNEVMIGLVEELSLFNVANDMRRIWDNLNFTLVVVLSCALFNKMEERLTLHLLSNRVHPHLEMQPLSASKSVRSPVPSSSLHFCRPHRLNALQCNLAPSHSLGNL